MITSSTDLTYFLELCHTLNFSRASERIGISQPSLSTAIQRVEKSIGTALFIRSKTGVFLTPAGKRLLSHSKQLLQLWETTKSECLASHTEIQGSFTFGIHVSVALTCLSKFLPEMLKKYPRLEIQLKHDLSRKILEGIINLSIDMGIIVNPLRHPDLIIHKLKEDLVTFWHTDVRNVEQVKIHQKNIPIICDPSLLQTEKLLKKLHQKGIQPTRMITSCSLEVIGDLAANGAGIAILPQAVASRFPLLKAIDQMPTYSDNISLVYRPENRPIQTIQEIIRAVKACFKN